MAAHIDDGEMMAREGCWGFRLPHARTDGVLIVA
jgi:hypothetical protein